MNQTATLERPATKKEVEELKKSVKERKLCTVLHHPSTFCKLNVKTCDLSNLTGIARKLIAPMLGIKSKKKLKLSAYDTVRTRELQAFTVARVGKLKKGEPTTFHIHSSRESHVWVLSEV